MMKKLPGRGLKPRPGSAAKSLLQKIEKMLDKALTVWYLIDTGLVKTN
ncbi:MAG: hypothetical protein ACLVEL_03275 [Ruthenibacterium sp.]